MTPPQPRPAATVVVCRALASGGFEVYLVKRHGRSGFMAGAHVFPGGRVDEADAELGRSLPGEARACARALVDDAGDDEAAALCVAAVRETAEECGLLLARTASGDVVTAERAARAVALLREEQPFLDVMRGEALLPDVGALAPLAWWITPEAEPKRFDTRFFLARAPAGQRPHVDEHEATEGEWLTPSAAVLANASGRIFLAPPTLATLEDLAEHAGVDEAARAVTRPLGAICPKLIADEAGLILALPGDPLHDDAVPVSARRTRVVLESNGRFASQLVSRR